MAELETGPIEALRAGAARPRRWRRTSALRDLVRETSLAPDDLVYPLFVQQGRGERVAVSSMPGIEQLSVEAVVGEARALVSLGIKAVLLFGLPEAKDPLGLESHADDGVVQRAIGASRTPAPSSS